MISPPIPHQQQDGKQNCGWKNQQNQLRIERAQRLRAAIEQIGAECADTQQDLVDSPTQAHSASDKTERELDQSRKAQVTCAVRWAIYP